MNIENFQKISLEKQQSVINAGYLCFAKDGFQKTAMSEISTEAGISKAALFHYFGTKENLYEFLFDLACAKIGANIPVGTSDFFECIAIATEKKFEVMGQYPGMYDFLVTVTKDNAKEAEKMRQKSSNLALSESSKVLFQNVDWAKFKDGITPMEVINMVTWISSGCLKSNPQKSSEELLAEIEKYLGLLKEALYREDRT